MTAFLIHMVFLHLENFLYNTGINMMFFSNFNK